MDLNEAQTRHRIIDKRLALAGWDVDDASQVTQELDIDLRQTHSATGSLIGHALAADNPFAGHRFADYALSLHGKPAAVIEAKRTMRDAELGREQALQYAKNIQRLHGGKMPLIFYTNGYDSYFWEYEFYPPTKVHGFPTRGDLEWLVQRGGERRPLSVEMINTGIVGRDYQIAAIRGILEGIEAKRRRFLLVMATGTGKTRTAVALLDVLARARWAKRVLFLVDRIALRDQAREAFKEFMPAEPRWPEQGEKEFARDRRIYITTYPAMLNLIQAGEDPRDWISPYFFDVIVADESHRSIYSTYKQVLDYFNGVKIGLTATPQDKIDHDTFQLFECDAQDPTFAYTYQEAVDHVPPYLSRFEVLKVRTKFQLEGIHGRALSGDDQRRLLAEGKDIEDVDFEGTDIERKVTNSGTNGLIVREFMEECNKDSSGTLPGKSIIFAISKAHARRIEELFDKLYPEHAGKLARVIVSEDPRVHGKGGLLDQFKNQDMPRVAISVDMLDTGVDIREVVNLVFAKPVFSFVKFWQMIGRGTRLLDADPAKRKPWCMDKDKFLVIDCWGNFEYFKMNPEGREPGALVPMPVRLFKARLDRLEAAAHAGRQDIVEAVKGDLRRDLGELPKNNVVVLENGADLARAKAEEFWPHLSTEGIGFLRAVIAPILRARSGADFKALRFETEVVELGTAVLADNKDAFEAIKQSLQAQVAELPLAVNIVAKERELIDAVQFDDWWLTPTEEKLRSLSERLAPLMKYRKARKGSMVHLDLDDVSFVKEWVECGPGHERVAVSVYREKAEAFVRELLDKSFVLQKIEAGEAGTEEELHELADELEHSSLHVNEDILRRVYDNKRANFIQFIRHMLGRERLAPWSLTVTSEFDDFIAKHDTFSSQQILFLQTLKTFIIQTGEVNRECLISQPFTNIHPRGILGLFQSQERQEIESFIQGMGYYHQ
ncbi:MAG TPA: restriction endonuclease subunit R [Elusimicrobia bacterium]|nr:restriction endonuclease subunit R [Elusimicrobiota bacterium]